MDSIVSRGDEIKIPVVRSIIGFTEGEIIQIWADKEFRELEEVFVKTESFISAAVFCFQPLS